IVVRPIEDRVLAFSIVPSGDPGCIVIAVAVARRHVQAIDVVPTDREGQRIGNGEVVRITSRSATGGLSQVVTAPGLVVDNGDDAGCPRAERILRSSVGIATNREHPDVHGGVIRGAPDLVEVPAVGAVERAYRAMSGDAWSTPCGIEIAGERASCSHRRTGNAQRPANHAHNRQEYQQGSPTVCEPTL